MAIDPSSDMILPEQYELLDFGGERRLERIGGVIVDRPCPAASKPREMQDWRQATSVFRPTPKRDDWAHSKPLLAEWQFSFEEVRLSLQATPSGQIGVFPEQIPNWQFIAKTLRRHENPKVLNLFGYTGASTLVAADAGAEVVHVDGAKSVVSWARRNAELSGLSEKPIRWIVEDAAKFVAREIKRGNHYDGIILDPPSYGHGPKGEEWKLTRDLFDLLGDCKTLLSPTPVLFLLSCHTPGFGAPELSAALSTCLFGSCGAGVKTRNLSLSTSEGRKLFAGHTAYWP